MSIYTDKGYDSRRHYLEGLAEDMGLDEQTVFLAADMLGPTEDFDGLITTLDDEANRIGEGA